MSVDQLLFGNQLHPGTTWLLTFVPAATNLPFLFKDFLKAPWILAPPITSITSSSVCHAPTFDFLQPPLICFARKTAGLTLYSLFFSLPAPILYTA